MDTILKFFADNAPLMVQFLLAVIGGGIISAYLTERWTRDREKKAILFDHVAALIRSYQIYIRALNQTHSERSTAELDQAHSAFYAEAKLLGLADLLKEESDDLLALANDLFSVRRNASDSKEDVERELAPIFQKFASLLDRIRLKL